MSKLDYKSRTLKELLNKSRDQNSQLVAKIIVFQSRWTCLETKVFWNVKIRDSKTFWIKIQQPQDSTLCAFRWFLGRSYGATILFRDLLTFTKVNWKSLCLWWIRYFSRPCSTTVGQLVGTIVCSNAAQLTSLTPFWIVIIYCILCMCYVVYYIGQEMSINLSNYNSTKLEINFWPFRNAIHFKTHIPVLAVFLTNWFSTSFRSSAALLSIL